MKWTDKEDSEFMIVRIIVFSVLALFTYYGFFDKQPCDLDAIYLSCRLTGSVADWIGCVLFYGGSLVLAGVPRFFGVEIFNPTGSSLFNTLTFLCMVAGIILIWA